MNLNRILSGVIFIGYVIAAFLREGNDGAFASFAVFFILLMLIWFGDLFGQYKDIGGADGPGINTPSPGWLVSTVAWVIFLIPLVFTIYEYVI